MPGSIGRGRLALRDGMGASSGRSSLFRFGASPSRGARHSDASPAARPRCVAGSRCKHASGAHIAAGPRFGSNCSGNKFHPRSRENDRPQVSAHRDVRGLFLRASRLFQCRTLGAIERVERFLGPERDQFSRASGRRRPVLRPNPDSGSRTRAVSSQPGALLQHRPGLHL